MISWYDSGIVLSAKRHGEKYKIVNILTKDHGKIHALAYKNKSPNFTNFAQVEVSYTSRDANSLGFWKLLSEMPTWIASRHRENHLLVCQSICSILDKLMPQNSNDSQIFELTAYISVNFQNYTSKEILLVYAYFEIFLLKNLGFSLDLYNVSDMKSCNDINEFLASVQFHNNLYQLLKISSQIIAKNLTNIDNFYRASIVRQLSTSLAA